MAEQQQESRVDGPRIPRTPERKPVADAALNADEFEKLPDEDPSKTQGRNAAILAARSGDWSKKRRVRCPRRANIYSSSSDGPPGGKWVSAR
eukprot:3996418-Pyramimonas_sp.AAC.1